MNNNENNLGYSFDYEISVITPIHIGGSEIISPIGDYIYKDSNIYFIDREKLGQLLIENNLVNDYVLAIDKISNEDKIDFLISFFKNRINNFDFNEIISGKSLPAFIKNNPVEISRFVVENENYYIPGSSLKGAINTAILYNWLLNKDNFKRNLEPWLIKIKQIDESSLKNNQQRKDKKKNFEKYFDEDVLAKCFGSVKNRERMPMIDFRVSDTSPLDQNDFSFYEIARFRIDNGEDDIPIIKECLVPKSKANGKLQITYSKIDFTKKKIYNHLIQNFIDKNNIIKLLNEFSSAVIEFELQSLSTLKKTQGDLLEYKKILNDLKQKCDSNQEIAYLRLGFGKMQFFQTIAVAIFNHFGKNNDNILWENYLWYCAGFPEELGEIYPITRALTTINETPLGWVEIKFA